MVQGGSAEFLGTDKAKEGVGEAVLDIGKLARNKSVRLVEQADDPSDCRLRDYCASPRRGSEGLEITDYPWEGFERGAAAALVSCRHVR